MSKAKAIVLEKNGGSYLVLDPSGAFRRVRSRINAEVGEEIEVVLENKMRSYRALLSIAALFLFTILSTLGWSYWQTPVAVAMLSVDINPSIEIALDKEAHIVSTKAQNNDAVQLLEGVNLKGEPLAVAMNKIVTRAIELRFLNTDHKSIILGLNEGSDDKASKLNDLATVDAQALQNSLNEVAISKDLGLQVVFFKLTSQEVAEAKNAGLSMGEYALWQTAEKAGLSIQSQSVKNPTERSNLLEVPVVKDELTNNRNMIDTGNVMEQPNREVKTTPGHKEDETKDKRPAQKKSGEQNSSETKQSTDSAHEEKPGTVVKGKNDNTGQLKRGNDMEEQHDKRSR
ncbi:anti-sigma factor domain-containing protein [Desulfosporosinus sp. Sb-LF]|uniref:anti-sigma factor domain-containing protein n=1 Tax=Desulfosporosinus sp. Sb-LF TaxID=2560027 RepID=UPI00107F6BC0|nr:anti-sigma factor domain-containing protein [Desulfosporosinus sp. Sb-LF]TGE31683.1 hypothetical protein E4K68_15835 [Desulfosporosinus sp. Sb-LF]